MAPRLIERLFGRSESVAVTGPVRDEPEPKRLLPESIETKANSVALLPKGAYGMNYVFFSPDGGTTIIDINEGPTVVAFMAYWYVALRWRAQKIAEPPLMVVEEDQDTGDMEWQPEHPLVPVLETPSPDYDMGELLEMTSHYLDNTGEALWVFSKDRLGDVQRITPFSRYEFEPKQYDGDDRLFGYFTVQTQNGSQDFDAETCAYFKDTCGLTRWGRGKSRLDVAMSWLKLGAKAQQTIYDLLSNSVWPSIVLSMDKDWDPNKDTYDAFKQDLNSYSKGGNKGKPFVALGGAQVTAMQASIKDLVPDEVLGRVESIIAAVSGVPAIVLQFQIGMENSPWSQMAQARKMAYDDCIQPAWKKLERVLTRQMLRGVDDDPTHYIRFDTKNVASLKSDQLIQAQIATTMGRAATLNERRAVMGLEPATTKQDPDDEADDIPELSQASIFDLLAGNAASGGDPSAPKKDETKPGQTPADGSTDDTEPKDEAASKVSSQATHAKGQTRRLQLPTPQQIKSAALRDSFREDSVTAWDISVKHLLNLDAQHITQIVKDTLLEPTAEGKSRALQLKAGQRGKDRVMSAITGYLRTTGKQAWTSVTTPLLVKAAERSTAVVAADLNVSFKLLHANVLDFTQQHAAKMIKGINSTTQDTVSRIIQGGLDEGQDTNTIAKAVSDSAAFTPERSKLIARTETTNAFNGAPTESLQAFGQSTGRKFTKTWSGVLDDRERDEHVAMEGETVGIDDTFSNDLQYPSEPNCRCTALYGEDLDT